MLLLFVSFRSGPGSHFPTAQVDRPKSLKPKLRFATEVAMKWGKLRFLCDLRFPRNKGGDPTVTGYHWRNHCIPAVFWGPVGWVLYSKRCHVQWSHFLFDKIVVCLKWICQAMFHRSFEVSKWFYWTDVGDIPRPSMDVSSCSDPIKSYQHISHIHK